MKGGIAMKGLEGAKRVYTTWNQIAKILETLPGNWEGFRERAPDVNVRLVPLCPGWFEVQVETPYGSYETAFYDVQGEPTCLRDWVPKEALAQADICGYEGIAVPEEVVMRFRERG
jgi:hypothetical protein